MSPKVNMDRKDLDPDKLAAFLRGFRIVYAGYDVTRFTATTVLGEIRFNITITERKR